MTTRTVCPKCSTVFETGGYGAFAICPKRGVKVIKGEKSFPYII